MLDNLTLPSGAILSPARSRSVNSVARNARETRQRDARINFTAPPAPSRSTTARSNSRRPIRATCWAVCRRSGLERLATNVFTPVQELCLHDNNIWSSRNWFGLPSRRARPRLQQPREDNYKFTLTS
jgi:hypothetical protein